MHPHLPASQYHAAKVAFKVNLAKILWIYEIYKSFMRAPVDNIRVK